MKEKYIAICKIIKVEGTVHLYLFAVLRWNDLRRVNFLHAFVVINQN